MTVLKYWFLTYVPYAQAETSLNIHFIEKGSFEFELNIVKIVPGDIYEEGTTYL